MSTRPLGTLADAETRAARMKAHDAFDPLWRRRMRATQCSKPQAREAAYAWLSRALGLPLDRTHIALFDRAMCDRVVALCTPYHKPGDST